MRLLSLMLSMLSEILKSYLTRIHVGPKRQQAFHPRKNESGTEMTTKISATSEGIREGHPRARPSACDSYLL